MCGILGGNSINWKYNNALDYIRHRGLDDGQIEMLENFVLGFVRLSIIDLSNNGMQPMQSTDGKVTLVFNGEIYGYKRIRKELIRRGYNFRSESDTEVILASYLTWGGEEFIDKIDGMFAIGICDLRDSKVRLYRDRLGIKPLYYYVNGGDFAFASELKSIESLSDELKLEIDNTAIYDYLHFRYIPEPKTIYSKVKKLMPGHRLVYNLDKSSIDNINSYWKLDVNTHKGSEKKQSIIIDDIRNLIRESVEEQIISDVPVGTFLSGGVDSSIISYECRCINPSTETFSIGFDDREVDESKYIDYFLLKYPMPSNRRIFKRADINQYYYDIKQWYDEPFADDSAYPTYLLSKLAKDKVTVVLTGDGSDEIFGGYERYNRMWKNDKNNMPDYGMIQKEYGGDIDSRESAWRKYFGIPSDYDRFWMIRKYYNMDLPPITRCQLFDIYAYLPGDILTKVDRVSMQVSLETRVPFLGRKLVEYAFSLSEEDRCPKGNLKGILKKAYEEEFGTKFLNRRKQGFGMPGKFFAPKLTKQEELLKHVWNIGNDMPSFEHSELDLTREYAEKHLAMVKLYDSWIEINQKGKRIDEYLMSKKIKTIAIYGVGIIGERLIKELRDSCISILYAIDKKSNELLQEIEIRNPNDDLDVVDAIIVTSNYYYNEIEYALKKEQRCR